MVYDLKDKKVFISGPMSGIEAYNVNEFTAAHIIVKYAGARSIYNPALSWLRESDKRSYGRNHASYMRECLQTMLGHDSSSNAFDVLVQLDDWADSDGAVCECIVAKSLGMDVISIHDVVPYVTSKTSDEVRQLFKSRKIDATPATTNYAPLSDRK